MRDYSSTYSPKYFKIVNDIDLSGYAETWTPIGENRTFRFGGIVDGNGKTIRGLNVDTGEEQYAGLFGILTMRPSPISQWKLSRCVAKDMSAAWLAMQR